MIMKALTYDYGGAESFFHLLERTVSEHDKLYTKVSPSHCEQHSLKLHSTKEKVPFKT